ncbi:MAG: RNA polymerase ECF-type sigma factor, partial [Candidatus Peregrinibacteria bacterium GW2011_GWA2_43_8]
LCKYKNDPDTVLEALDPSEVEDIAAQVFMRAWDNLGRFKFQGVSFGAWLFKIAHNLIVDKYRTHRSIAEIPVDLADERESSDPRYITRGKMDQLVLKKALNELTDTYRQVVILKFINGFSNQEIAEILKRREGNVRILQFRALRELKGVLQKMGYEW